MEHERHCFNTFPEKEERVKPTTYKRELQTNLDVFGNGLKHILSIQTIAKEKTKRYYNP